MIHLFKRVAVPVVACGLAVPAGAIAQVVQEPAQIPADRPANTAILADADPAAQEAVDVVRRVGEILSGEVRGRGDEGRIAAISDLIMDGEGKPHYVLLSRGGVGGLGGETIAVPIGAAPLTYAEDGGWRLQLEMTGDQLQQAPTLEAGALDQLRDPSWIQATRQFFQAEPAASEAEINDETLLFRAGALKGAQVRGNGGDESIANVDDVLLDADFRATYAVLGYGGVAGLGKNQVPVPFRHLQLNAEAEGDRYALAVAIDRSKEQLQAEDAPTLDGEYNRMLDPAFIDRVDAYFEADPAAPAAIDATEPTPRP